MAGAERRVLAVVGDPVAHSLSPAMHNAAIEALGIDAVYVALRTTHRGFRATVVELLRAGGACNVTSPYKDDAYALAGAHSPAALRTHAVNTIWGSADHPALDNTDVLGIRDAARVLMGGHPVPAVRIIGTGGAARAAACAAADEWPRAVLLVASRTRTRAEGFVRWAREAGVHAEVAGPGHAGEALYINATPATDARAGAEMVPDPARMRPQALLDLNYRRGATPLVQAYRHAGVRAEDGRAVLVGQGAAAFALFFGVPAPLAVMQRAVDDALGA
jgi:shikimate dehydrogenase